MRFVNEYLHSKKNRYCTEPIRVLPSGAEEEPLLVLYKKSFVKPPYRERQNKGFVRKVSQN